jgi:hypothetical protein
MSENSDKKKCNIIAIDGGKGKAAERNIQP